MDTAASESPLFSKGRLKCGTSTMLIWDVMDVPGLVWWVILTSSLFWEAPQGFGLPCALSMATTVELANSVPQAAPYSVPLGSSVKPM